ncbi:MAG: hypothetical protein ABH828_02935 [archaeon]
MINIKKVAVISTIAILFAFFIFSFIDALYERPEYCRYYDDYGNEPVIKPINQTDEERIIEQEKYTECQTEYDLAMKDYRFFRFLITSVIGLAAVILSIYLPFKKDSLKEWLLTGFMIGGLAAIFIATADFFSDAHRIIKPIILLIEILLVMFVAYKKIKK